MFQIPVREADPPSEAEKLIFSSCHLPPHWTTSPLQQEKKHALYLCPQLGFYLLSQHFSPCMISLVGRNICCCLVLNSQFDCVTRAVRRRLLPPAAKLLLRRHCSVFSLNSSNHRSDGERERETENVNRCRRSAADLRHKWSFLQQLKTLIWKETNSLLSSSPQTQTGFICICCSMYTRLILFPGTAQITVNIYTNFLNNKAKWG